MSLTPAQSAALRELAAVAESIAGYLFATRAYTPARQIVTILTPVPSEHFAAAATVVSNAEQLIADMQVLANPATVLPRSDLTHAHVDNLLRAFEAAYQGARRDGAL